MSDKLQVFEQTAFTPEETARMGLKVLAEYLKAGTEALQRLSLLQAENNERMKRLERQMALERPVSQGQASNIWRAMRERAAWICEKNGLPVNAKGSRASAARLYISRQVRLALYKRFGVTKVDAVPRVEYQAAIELIDGWMDLMAIGKARQAQEAADRKQEAAHDAV